MDYIPYVEIMLLIVICIFEFLDFNYDSDLQLLKEQNRLVTNLIKIVEKIETRLEQLYIEQIKR